jgi:hypothetical protein
VSAQPQTYAGSAAPENAVTFEANCLSKSGSTSKRSLSFKPISKRPTFHGAEAYIVGPPGSCNPAAHSREIKMAAPTPQVCYQAACSLTGAFSDLPVGFLVCSDRG